MVASEQTCAEIEPLRDVVVGFAGWNRVIDVQRAEGRIPDQACSHGGADRARIGGRERLRQPGKGGLAAIAPEATGIREKGPLESGPPRQPWDGRLQLHRCRPVVAAADIVQCGARREIAWPEAVRRKAADKLRPSEKAAQEGQVLATQGGAGTALESRACDQ